ncbi:MAG: histidine ammonia-lyase [Sulfobacillus benefaciens]|uniref:Histidine ammonia-lyase n=1 Tax=Sulfobacillus benefaciens TaxID=453960 RepID=A0A2T2XAT5_9FIRM|nr:MAG: histidine ammonia-lyase [Sulfobacillus benefaciens]
MAIEGVWPVDGQTLTPKTVYQVAVDNLPVILSSEVAHSMAASRRMVERYLDEERIVYGITTGFGRFSDVVIPDDLRQLLQLNLLRSHAAGVGSPFDPSIARAMVLLRANALAKGYSGIRIEVVETLLAMLNRGVTPIIPSQGSVGASGDLAPLAHLALVLVGEGQAWFDGAQMSAVEALSRAGLAPLVLQAKEGLALINGTQAMGAMGALAVYQAELLADWADILGSLTTEVLRGIPMAFSEAVARVRPHPGIAVCAENLRRLTDGSRLTTLPGELRVQDAYSIRCMPQVHGASRDGLRHVAEVVTREINSATDNPLLFEDLDLAISAGNFHGQPIALVLDYLAIILAEWASISERRIERMVNPALSGLPAFLVAQGGINSGLMLAQYTAASLVSENKVLAHPSSVDSIPTSANQEDHVSMGTTAGRKALQVLENLQTVLAIEAICGAQAADLLGPHLLSPRGKQVYDFVRQRVLPWEHDRILAPDIAVMKESLGTAQARALVESLLDY